MPRNANKLSHGAAAARLAKGVRQVVRIDEAVAVVADHMGAAKKGLAAAAIQWDDGPHATVGSADIVRQLEEASKRPGAVARNDGDKSPFSLARDAALRARLSRPLRADTALSGVANPPRCPN
jgi:isoquinoline 1-oxidoreductase beta subunit